MAIPTKIVNLAQSVGEDKVYQDTIYQSDGSTLQNISGWQGQFVVHTYSDPTNVLILKTTAGGMTPVDSQTPPVGYVNAWNISVARADTVGMPPGEYQYRVERTDAGNDAVVTRGCFTLEPV